MDNLYLSQMIGEPNYDLIAKWLPIREREVKKYGEVEITVYEPLVADIMAIEKGGLDMVDFIFRNTTLEKREIELLPFSIFENIKGDILAFVSSPNSEQGTQKKNK